MILGVTIAVLNMSPDDIVAALHRVLEEVTGSKLSLRRADDQAVIHSPGFEITTQGGILHVAPAGENWEEGCPAGA